MFTAWGVFAALQLGAIIEAPGNCPSAPSVLRRLSPSTGQDPALTAVIRQEPEQVRLTLRRSDRVAVERAIPNAHSCAQRAELFAAIIETWRTRWEADNPLPPLPAVPPPPSPWRFRASAAAGVALWPTVAPRAEVELLWQTRDGGGGLAIEGVGLHQLSLSPGRVRWARLSVTPQLTGAVGGRLRWEGALGVSLSGLSLAGEGFDTNRSVWSFDVGPRLAVRLLWAEANLKPWVGGYGRYGLITHQARVENGSHASLPRLDAGINVGLSFGQSL